MQRSHGLLMTVSMRRAQDHELLGGQQTRDSLSELWRTELFKVAFQVAHQGEADFLAPYEHGSPPRSDLAPDPNPILRPDCDRKREAG